MATKRSPVPGQIGAASSDRVRPQAVGTLTYATRNTHRPAELRDVTPRWRQWVSSLRAGRPVGCLSVAPETLEAPSNFHDLLRAPNTAVLSTVLPDGSLQGSPVWYWFDGVLVHVSTLASRQKYRNLRRDPRLALTVFDPAQPLRYIEIRGTAELHDDPDGEMRDRIAVKHGFPDGTAFDPPGAKRVIATIMPTRIRTSSRD